MELQHNTWLAYCRAGFEGDLVEEFQALAGTSAQEVRAAPGSGFVHATFSRRARKPVWRELVFARQFLSADAAPVPLPERDRVTPLLEAAISFADARAVPRVGDVLVEYPDTNEGKALSKLAQALQTRLATQLAARGRMASDATLPRLHILLTPAREAWLGLGDPRASSPWHNGIPRLRMPREAPSRSTLKLAEAFHVFLGDKDERLLQSGMRAVDLGAAPGGWTWQLVHRGLHVTAVDNGPLKGELVDNALVRHLREDGFRYRPRRPVDWLVCDMVEKPARIAALVASWFSERWTERAVFNLKLPMKKRVAEVARCRDLVEAALEAQGRPYELRIRQLYHDREEVTGYCRFVPRSERR